MMMIVIAALAAVQGAGPGPVNSRQLSDARDAFDARLFDYPSARFRETRGNGFILCGMVNAKNRMGAYTGWQQFAVYSGSDDDGPGLYIEDSTDGGEIMLEICSVSEDAKRGKDWSAEISYRR